jgi:hypothetical protein
MLAQAGFKKADDLHEFYDHIYLDPAPRSPGGAGDQHGNEDQDE